MHTEKTHRLDGVRKAVGLAAVSSLLLALGAVLIAPVASAVPGEPAVSATISPNDPTVNASDINPVDTSFVVNFSATSVLFQEHQVWVNVTFATSTGWRVNPTIANLTMTVSNMNSESRSVSVTVTVPPKVSANEVAVFTASYRVQNDIRFTQPTNGSVGSDIHIRQIFSTSAEFENANSSASVRQGQNTNISIRVTNRGNGDASYDAQLKNAAELAPSDVILQSTTPATVPQNGSAVVRLVIHANPQAIAGSYTLQLRVLAAGAGTPPPAGAFADLTAQLTVLPSATPPPVQPPPTQPPPAQNNTTTPPPPPPNNPDILAGLTTPVGMTALGLIGASLIAVALVWRRHTKALKQRREALAKARQRRMGPGAMQAGPGGPPGQRPVPSSGARPAGAVTPVRRVQVRTAPGAPKSPAPVRK